jgi:phosphopantetheinyl transferase (holo-ACP synthase)
MRYRGGNTVHVSITHDGGKAVAFVILEKGGGAE